MRSSIASRVKSADPTSIVKTPIRINVWLNKETAHISLDLSGEGLHLRGYRDSTGMAPIKETLASAIVMRSGWVPGDAALDQCAVPVPC